MAKRSGIPQVTPEELDEALRGVVDKMTTNEILRVPGVREVLERELRSEIIDQAEANRARAQAQGPITVPDDSLIADTPETEDAGADGHAAVDGVPYKRGPTRGGDGSEG